MDSLWDALSILFSSAASIVGLVIMLAMAIAVPSLVGSAILGPINRAAGRLKAPTRFFLSDFLWLLVHIQFALAYCVEFVGIKQRYFFPLLIGFLVLAAVALWAGGVSFLSRAAVIDVGRRATFILVLLPGTLALMMFATLVFLVVTVLSIGYLSFPLEYRSQFQNGYRALNLGNAGLITLALLLPVLGYGLRRLSLWVVAKAGDGLMVATNVAAAAKTEGASRMSPTVQSDTSSRSRSTRADFAAASRRQFAKETSRQPNESSRESWRVACRRSSFGLTLLLAGVVHAGVASFLDDLAPGENGVAAQERSNSAANSSTSGAASGTATSAAPSEKKAAPESELPESFPGKLRLRLPPVIQAVVGLETNLYFDNVILTINPANFAPDVICTKGKQQVERWTFTPVDADVGDHPLKLEFRDDENRLVARAVTTLRVVAADAKKDQELSLLLIGDSLTHASVYPQRLVELCKQPGNPKLTLVGSYGPGGMPGEVRHEGYGGWTAQRFATHFTGTAREGDYRMRGSPFLYRTGDAAPRLDFARYCADVNGGKTPDVVAVFLGPNDIFSLNDETLEAGLDNILKHYDQLREMVQTPGSTTKFAAMLPAPPAATQDAFGANYASGQTRWQYKRNQHRLVERLLETYGGREAERIYVVPVHLNLDALNNYPSRLDAPNLHAETKSVRLNNGVHPSAPGYRQIGDALYAWLKTQ